MDIPNSWTFKSDDIATAFDQHVREQLPWYDIVTNLIAVIARHYLPEHALAYDIGASTGNLGVMLKDTIQARHIAWVGIDNAVAMKKVYRAPGNLKIADAISYPFKPFNLAVCFLSLMFMAYDQRKSWLLSLIDKMKPGGAIIIIDRQEPASGILEVALQRAIWQQKKDNGASGSNIVKKELSLAGIQRPVPLNFFTGINAVEIFRFGTFAGWVIEKK